MEDIFDSEFEYLLNEYIPTSGFQIQSDRVNTFLSLKKDFLSVRRAEVQFPARFLYTDCKQFKVPFCVRGYWFTVFNKLSCFDCLKRVYIDHVKDIEFESTGVINVFFEHQFYLNRIDVREFQCSSCDNHLIEHYPLSNCWHCVNLFNSAYSYFDNYIVNQSRFVKYKYSKPLQQKNLKFNYQFFNAFAVQSSASSFEYFFDKYRVKFQFQFNV